MVDDGSNDGTGELIRQWQQEEKEFEIRYVYQNNGGMHTAHNTAYERIDTELNVCIDSDDCLADGAVEAILQKWKSVRGQGYAGIIGLDADMNTGNIIGTGFPRGMTETTLGGYYAAGGSGDKKLVYRTDVMRKYPPYPVFEGEKYVALSYKYLLCDQEYKLAVLDKVLCNVEYQIDGSSNTMWRQYVKNPNGFAFLRRVDMIYPNSGKKLITACIHYISSNIIAKNKGYIRQSPRKCLTILLVPFGWMLSKYVQFRAKRS